MKKKNLISLSVAFAFLALSITGLLLFAKQKSHATEITHTVFGLVFVSFAIFHILNNWSSITGYSKERKSGKWQKEFIYAGIGFILVLVGGFTEVLEPVAEVGRIFAKPRQRPQNLTFSKIETNKEAAGNQVSIMVQLGKETKMPVLAIWTEDIEGKFIDNLFVPSKIAFEKEPDEPDEIEFKDFDKNILPAWSKIASDSKSNFDGESPKENFILDTKTVAKAPYLIVVEIKSGEKIQVFKTQADSTSSNIYKLSVPNGGLVSKIIVEREY